MYALRVGSAWEVFAPAKLNLCLEVIGTRPDGFHNLESLLVPIRLYDHLRWLPPSAQSNYSLQVRSLAIDSLPLPDQDQDNLVLRATDRLAQAAGIEPQGRFQLFKRIPMQAGLGGGSSDAAAALLLANAAWGINYPTDKLMELAAEIGSDIPFFLAQGPAVCRGRGEIVEQVRGLPRLNFVLVKPEASLSTPTVFGQWRQQRHCAHDEQGNRDNVEYTIDSLRRGSLYQAGRSMINHLQAAAAAISPTVERLCDFLSKQGFAASGMSGSGTACWGLARSARHARILSGRLTKIFGGQVFCVSSCSAA